AGSTTSNELTFPNGNGMTPSSGPAVPTFDGTFNGTIDTLEPSSTASDGFLAKVKVDGTGLEYAGYLGGNGIPEDALLSLETAIGVAVDQSDNVYVTGRTNSRRSLTSSQNPTQITFPDGLG